MVKLKGNLFVFTLITIFSLPNIVTAAPKNPTTVGEIAFYKGVDRQKILEEGAKKEGKLSLYTVETMEPLRLSINAFQKKYPYIKVDHWRAGSDQQTPRITEEYQAGKYIVDAIVNQQEGEILLREKAISRSYYSPNLVYVEEGATIKTPDGGASFAGFYVSALSCGFNTNLVTRNDLPKTYEDLLNPRWKGKMAIPGSSTGVKWVGNIYEQFGEEFVKRLAKQDIVVQATSGTALVDMIIAGEYPFSPAVSHGNVALSKKKGAPIDWRPLEPVPVHLTGIMLAKNSTHPHAAMLYIDFVLSKQGSEIYKDVGYISLNKQVPNEVEFKKYYGPYSSKQIKQWNQMYQTLFLKQ